MTTLLTIYLTGAVVSFWAALLTARARHDVTRPRDVVTACVFLGVTWPVMLPVVTIAQQMEG